MAAAFRLDPSVRPTRYHVELSTDPSRETFTGVATIELTSAKTADRIRMHAKHLSLSDAVFDDDNAAQIDFDAPTETVTFVPQRPISGRSVLRVSLSGKPNPGMHGLYLATDGEERAICTQCEATDARAIFPCFDEPAFKAPLRFTILTSPEATALANGPLERMEQRGNQQAWLFEETDTISSYLAAFVVGDFEGTEPTEVRGIPIRVFAMRGKTDQAAFAHGFTEKLFPYYEDYFGVPYPYGKYDQVAVPGFDAGAMENVGLVLFRQNLLLMNPKSASWNQEKLIAKVIAHELAHMWFGNLVTMAWWDDLWLNEAFAEWFAHKATHAVEPTYQVWADFQADKNRALVDDALPTTHPIYAEVETPDQALEMFDVITYQKGCAVMRMLENYLGEDAFRAGIRTYMAAFARGNAKGRDLWHHLEQASGQPVGALMKSWIEQPGFPCVSVDVDGGTLSLSQRRFFSKPNEPDAGQIWNVPIIVRFADDEGEKTHRFILSERASQEALPASGAVKWLYANAAEIGFYRVDLRGGARTATLECAATTLSEVEQMGFVEDQWALVRNATRTLQDFLPLVESLASSDDHNVLRGILDRLGTLERMLSEREEIVARTRLRSKIAELFAPHLDALGWEPNDAESQNDRQRRALAIYALASLARSPEHVATCETWMEKERADPRSVDANLAGTFVGVAAKHGDEARYETWIATYLERKSKGAAPQDSLRYLYTLAAFRPAPLVERTLAALHDGVVPQEAVGSVLSQLLGTRHGRLAAWENLRASWSGLRERVGDMGISRVVESVGHLPADRREEIVAFFEENPPVSAERALARALESMDQREELYARLLPQLLQWLG